MSGYLQRLVNSAAGFGDAVHPRTGSLFSPRREDVSSSLQHRDDTDNVTPAQPRPPSHAPSAAVEPPAAPHIVTSGSEYVPLLPAPVETDSVATAPHTPTPVRAALEPRVEPVVTRHRQPADPSQRRLAAAADDPMTPSADRSVDDAFRPFAKPTGVPDADGRSVTSRRTPQKRHEARHARQPDDIEIHIGRIEVIAMPPPAPRAPKTPDRSLSLDAYLSRRDGRAK